MTKGKVVGLLTAVLLGGWLVSPGAAQDLNTLLVYFISDLRSGTFSIGTGKDVVLSSDGDGAVTVTANGDGFDEAITVNLDDTENQATVSSTTGVTLVELPGYVTLPNNVAYRMKNATGTAVSILSLDSANVLKVTANSAGTISFVTSGTVNLVDNSTNGAVTRTLQTITAVASAAGATITATNAIPAGCFLAGVTTRIYTAFGATNGLTSIDIGTAGDPDGFGNDEVITINATTSNADWTAGTLATVYAAATSIIVTGNGDGGNEFDATGNIRVTTHCLNVTAAGF